MNGVLPCPRLMNEGLPVAGGGGYCDRHPGLLTATRDPALLSYSKDVIPSRTWMCATITNMEVTSTTSRKIRKPLMEKKRRARINDSLNELRRLLAEASTQDSEKAKAAKLEKADILELAVKHVQYLHDRVGLSGQEENTRGHHNRTGTKASQERSGEQKASDHKKASVLGQETVRVTRLPSGEVALIISTRPTSHPTTMHTSQPRLMWRPW